MPALEAPTQAVIDSWKGLAQKRERGVRDGGSPNESLEVDNNTATRVIHVDWLGRFAWAQWMLGHSQVYTPDGSTTPELSRLLPQRHPVFPKWVATKVTRMRGHKWLSWDATNQVNVFETCEAEVLYEQVPFNLLKDEDTDDETDRYFEFPAGDPEPAGEYLSYPGAAFKFTADPAGPNAGAPMDNKPIPQNVGRVVPTIKFLAVWHRLPFADLWNPASPWFKRLFGATPAAVPYFGTVNKTTFRGFQPGTLLLSGVRPRRRKSPTGLGYELDVGFELTYKPTGWLNAYAMEVVGAGAGAPANDGFYQVTTDHVYRDPGSMPDFKSVYCVRALEDCVKVS